MNFYKILKLNLRKSGETLASFFQKIAIFTLPLKLQLLHFFAIAIPHRHTTSIEISSIISSNDAGNDSCTQLIADSMKSACAHELRAFLKMINLSHFEDKNQEICNHAPTLSTSARCRKAHSLNFLIHKNSKA